MQSVSWCWYFWAGHVTHAPSSVELVHLMLLTKTALWLSKMLFPLDSHRMAVVVRAMEVISYWLLETLATALWVKCSLLGKKLNCNVSKKCML